jgi:hypothetical protein
MIDKALVLENRRGVLSSRRKQEHQSQNRTPTLGPASTSIPRLLDLSSAPSLRVFNRCPNLLNKDLLPHSGRWFRTPTSFRLQTLGIIVLKGPRPTILQPRTHCARNVTTVDRRVISLIHAPKHIHVLLCHRKLLQHHRQLIMEALLQPKLGRTTLEGGWIKWLWKKLRTTQSWCLVHLSSILFCLNLSLLSFLFCSLESRGEILVKGVVLSRPKISNFEMWLNFTKFWSFSTIE